MSLLCCVICSVTIVVVWLPSLSLSTGYSFMDEDIAQLVLLHNKYRSQITPPAVEMRMMTWNSDLSKLAQAKAEECVYSHGVRVHHPKLGELGENIYVTDGSYPRTRYFQRAVFKWNAEVHFYNLATNICETGEKCGHYTQLAWSSTYMVGCGLKFCSGPVSTPNGDLINATLIFCEYYPSGNKQAGFLFNTKPAPPYTTGAPCSSCPEDVPICESNLCCTPNEHILFNKYKELLKAVSSVSPEPTNNTTTHTHLITSTFKDNTKGPEKTGITFKDNMQVTEIKQEKTKFVKVTTTMQSTTSGCSTVLTLGNTVWCTTLAFGLLVEYLKIVNLFMLC
uniref:Glioma pathogenesis-related protein 1-like n=1 Tax=Ciona intestinalis TaxID=7719 RepID=F6UBE7_CIOIN|nr:glioma pathogenesis-related protein 1-like [Ciona intestinalis]|eukprot:XP_004225947.1 glioma pathogenesis-related protein 1-like [Ciona intestinalis]